ncbi:MAG: YggS family pyridoxal phosphate-dependent enzyme, partial [Lachnospiraceae bacterium]|nr:YggS family pyridoxal phosphate-dependent enzyme [Lachnospiraceae bacterium]
MSICDNCLRVREKLYDACLSAGREPSEVRPVAVTKFVDIARIEEAVRCGFTEVGENRVQELKDKQTYFKERDLRVHMIGQLQLNKVKYICNRVDMIQSVDRTELVDRLEEISGRNEAVQDILLQVNIGDEPQKGGVKVAGLDDLFDYASERPHLRIRGLMCVPPASEGDSVRKYFSGMYGLFTRLSGKSRSDLFDILSMGMSHDYELAVLEGAT